MQTRSQIITAILMAGGRIFGAVALLLAILVAWIKITLSFAMSPTGQGALKGNPVTIVISFGLAIIALHLIGSPIVSFLRDAIDQINAQRLVLSDYEDLLRAAEYPLLDAVLRDDPERVQQLLKDGEFVDDYEISKERTALMLGAANGSVEIVNILLAAGATVDKSDTDGQTALMAASEAGSEKVVETLISAGADVDHKDHSGNTPLMLAASIGANPEVVNLLLEAGANAKRRDNRKVTTLMKAVLGGNAGIVEKIIEAGVNVNTRVVVDGVGATALGLATELNNREIKDLLIKAGANK